MSYKVDELELAAADRKFKTEELLNVDEIFSDSLSTKVGERKIRTGLVKIYPEMAKKLLTKNPNNRQVKPANVNFLVREINEGRWVLNGEPVIIDSDGNIADGQHRLWACVKTDTPITTMVVIGVSPAAITTIDTGTKRIAKDCLDMYSISNASLAASTIKLVTQFNQGAYGEMGSMNRILSNQEVIDYYLDNQDKIEKSVTLGISLYKKSNQLVTPSIIGGLHYLCAKKSVREADEFFTKLCTGIGLELGSPITALKRRLDNDKNNKTKMPQKERVELIIHGWNKFRNGETCTSIKVPKDTKIAIQ